MTCPALLGWAHVESTPSAPFRAPWNILQAVGHSRGYAVTRPLLTGAGAAITRGTGTAARTGDGIRVIKQPNTSSVSVYMGIRYRGRDTAHDIAPKPETAWG